MQPNAWLGPVVCSAVVTFHSLEDRIVKQFFAARTGRGGGSRSSRSPSRARRPRQDDMGPVERGETEIAANPRARSAKLRSAIRTAAPARQDRETGIDGLAALPGAEPGRKR